MKEYRKIFSHDVMAIMLLSGYPALCLAQQERGEIHGSVYEDVDGDGRLHRHRGCWRSPSRKY